MKSKKMNTVPNGIGVIIVLAFAIRTIFLMGIVLLPSLEAIGLFLISGTLLVSLIQFINNNYCNFIDVSTESIRHKMDSYSWENVCITIGYTKPNFLRNAYVHWAFFDDHYLTKEEINSKSLKRKGFYLELTRKRTKWLLSTYKKPIIILEEAPYYRNKDIITQIRLHNLKIEEIQEHK